MRIKVTQSSNVPHTIDYEAYFIFTHRFPSELIIDIQKCSKICMGEMFYKYRSRETYSRKKNVDQLFESFILPTVLVRMFRSSAKYSGGRVRNLYRQSALRWGLAVTCMSIAVLSLISLTDAAGESLKIDAVIMFGTVECLLTSLSHT